MDLRGTLSRAWGRIRDLQPRTILLLGYTVFMLWAFPGYMSTDSVFQLAEARAAHFSDGNPPLMAVEWMVLDRIVSGPILMLLLQSILFLGGLYLIFCRFVGKRAAAWTAIGVLLFPPVMTTVAVIWKDTQMAAYLVAGIAGLIQPNRKHRLIGLGLLLAACLMRHNALAAVAPLVGILFEWKNPIRWYKRLALFVVAAVLALGALVGSSKLIARTHVRLTPVFYDILGMVAYGDESDDAKLREILRGTPLAVDHDIQERARSCFEKRGVWRVVIGEDRLFDYPVNDAQWDALYRAWRELIARDPGAYAASHWAVFRLVLGIDERPRAPVYDLFVEVPDQRLKAEHASYPSRAQQYAHRVLYFLADETPLFRPWIYAVVGLLLLPLFCRDRVTLALIISGLLYELSFVPPFAEPDFRYSHWMITTVVISAVLLFIQRRQRAKAAAT
ncbi:MAG TPA: hypothetical protein VL326_00605 [Kofleriaceae bacterium]|nr:hypothetical protein [Kofleriaceae bacterium]